MKQKPETTTLIEGVAGACVLAAIVLAFGIIWMDDTDYLWQLLFSVALIFALCVLLDDEPEEEKKPELTNCRRFPWPPVVNERYSCFQCKTKNVTDFKVSENHIRLLCNECGSYWENIVAKNV